MSAHVEWEGGGEARFVSLRGDAVGLVSTVAKPPGSRPVGALVEEPRESVRVKVHLCRVREDGRFGIEGRLIDVTRAMHARLEALASERPE